ncbi:MAG: hypothetical protein DMD91_09470 [Candidatus Rokuibacteriota bacterium]|nr:MAG: hypothetical protein DMD91_09470 [Candidatus Rokubacteria bacterium]
MSVLPGIDRMFCTMEPIEFDLVVEELDSARPHWMRCQGSIVRVEHLGIARRAALARGRRLT